MGSSSLAWRSGSDSEAALVAVPGVPSGPLNYRIPPGMTVVLGQRVQVPLQNRTALGVVVGFGPPPPDLELKPIEGIPDPDLVLDPPLLELARWMARYYLTPLGEVLRLFFPPGLIRQPGLRVRFPPRAEPPPGLSERERRIVALLAERRGRWLSLKWLARQVGGGVESLVQDLVRRGILEARRSSGLRRPGSLYLPGLDLAHVQLPQRPTPEQRKALERLIPALRARQFTPFLLHGVTGSGKTALYLWLAQEALHQGLGVILLVPEKGLTPQVLGLFLKALPNQVLIYHSSLAAGERYRVWKELKSGRYRLVIGPRSALFLPVQNLGLIVVDEEHDGAYKEEGRPPRYHARNVAAVRARLQNALLVLGSATPAIETYHNAERGKYGKITLTRRVRGYRFPRVRILDLREEPGESIFSIRLLEEIQRVVAAGKQAILFLNRRGFSPHLQCRDCGHIFRCPDCSVSMTYHRSEEVLRCHLCGKEAPVPDACPLCRSLRLRPIGFGTERVEAELRRFFPDLPMRRMDLDTMARKGAHEEVFEEMRTGRVRLLIGTQMVTKGFDFPEVELVGVLSADITLGLPDFRAEERTFQLLTQVIGRVRRGGQVLIQTFAPESPALRYALRQDYRGFYREEIEARRAFRYPPFTRLLLVEGRGPDRALLLSLLQEIRDRLRRQESPGLEVLGPAPAPIERIRGEYRVRLLLRGDRPYGVQQAFEALGELRLPRSTRLLLDMDPYTLL